MKKVFTILLTLVMVLAMAAPAFAAENATLTIANSDGKTYDAYKLLNLTTSLKTGSHHDDHDGDHTDDCYNFAYSVNEKYRTIMQEEVLANGGNYLWEGTAKPATAAGVTDDQILKYLSNQTSDNGDVSGTLRVVADDLYRAIKAADMEADKTGLTGTNDEFAQGYWLIADVTDLDGEEKAANSLVMVDTKGQDALTVTPKTALPTVEKKVKDIEDSEDDSFVDNAWADTADHDIGSVIPFKLTGTLPSNAQYYTSYKMVFHDTMAAALTLKADSLKVYMYETKHKADVDIDMNDFAKDVTDSFTVTTTGLTDDCTFEVSCDNIFDIEGVTKDSVFVVFYEATMGETPVIGADGNTNEVFLEFSNDPYNTASTGKTEADTVAVYSYKLVINKTDSHGHSLEGAGFTLYKKIAGTFVKIGDELKGDGMTTFTWTGLDDGDYKLEESTVPAGYNKMSDILFSISAEHAENGGVLQLVSLDGGLMGAGDVVSGTIEKDIENKTGTVLPETGAAGTMMLICGGAMFVMIAGVFMITRKKMSIFED